MTEYLNFQTIIQFRIPVGGGQPEVLKKFTTEFSGSHAVAKKVPKKAEFGGVINEEVVL